MHKKSIHNHPECPSAIQALSDTLDVLGGKWTLLILHYLIDRVNEVNTFNKIEKEIEGISARMLSRELKMLEMNQLISRTELFTKPKTVQYQITQYGLNVAPLIQQLVAWGMQHRTQLFQH